MQQPPAAAKTSDTDLESMGREVHEMAIAKGWWSGMPTKARVNLLMDWLIEEVEEAREAFNQEDAYAWTLVDSDGIEKPEGFPSELADIFLIVMDLANRFSIDFPVTVRQKLDYNHVRRYRRDAQGKLIEGAD